MKLTFFLLWILLAAGLSYQGMSKPRDGGLTPKEARFVENYLIYLNATRAFLEAGYQSKTNGAARVAACKLLTKPNVAAAIMKAREERSKIALIDQHDVIRELKILAFARPDSVFEVKNGGVSVKDFDTIRETDPDALLAIQEVSETTTKEGGSTRAKMYDKTAALKLLGMHLGMFGESGTPKGDGDEADGDGSGVSKRTRGALSAGISSSVGRLRAARSV